MTGFKPLVSTTAWDGPSLTATSTLLPPGPSRPPRQGLGHVTRDMGPEILDLWIESQLGQAEIHYWQDEPDQLAAVLAIVGPWFEAEGEPCSQESGLPRSALLWQLTDRRHRVDDEVLENAKKVLVAKTRIPSRRRLRGRPAEVDVAWAVFNVGFCSLWYGDLDGAEDKSYSHTAASPSVRGLPACAL